MTWTPNIWLIEGEVGSKLLALRTQEMGFQVLMKRNDADPRITVKLGAHCWVFVLAMPFQFYASEGPIAPPQ